MGLFEMIVLISVIATVGKVADTLASRVGTRDPARSDRQIAALEAQLQETSTRLASAEEQVTELADRVDFLENLLAEPSRPRPLRRGETTPDL